MNKSDPADKIILAVDGLNKHQALSLLEECPKIKWIKIGLELFSREGPEVIRVFRDMNKKIFLDLKFHDIPNTMRNACYEISRLGVNIISLHAMSGSKALKISKQATIEGAENANVEHPLVVGVTVLTSLSKEEFRHDLNISSSIEENVIRFARISHEAGLDGCVCSAWEAEKLRLAFGDEFQLITPGIRVDNDTKDDQSRVMNPYDALSRGSSRIVIGRSITQSPKPKEVFEEICNQIS